MIRTKTGRKDNPYIMMGMLIVMWASFSAVSKLVLAKLDSFQIQFYMFGLAAAVMTITMCLNGKIAEFRKLTVREYAKLGLYALPSFLYFFLYILALKMIPAVEASMLNYLFPFMIVIFAVPINKERLDVLKLVSIFLGFAGIVIIIINGSLDGIKLTNLAGDLLAIGAAVCWGVFSNLGKRNKVDQFVSNYVYNIVAFVLSSICMFTFSSFAIPDITAFSGVLWLGLSNIVFAYYLWIKVLKMTSSALAASLSFVTPFFSLMFIMLLTGEKITLVQVEGFLLIIVGIAIQSLYSILGKRLWQKKTTKQIKIGG